MNSSQNVPLSVASQIKHFEETLKSLSGPFFYHLLGLSKIAAAYREVKPYTDDDDFVTVTLERLNVQVDVAEESLANIPKNGPVIVVSNHPFGGIEGLILVELLTKIRSDVRLLANYLLNYIPEIKRHFISVDPFGTNNSVKSNITPLRDSISWIKNGGLLAIFPAGTVSHLQLSKREVTDPEWSRNVAGIIRKTGAPVVPIFFHGRNGFLFQLLGLFHSKIRTALLARELINKKNSIISLDIGSMIPNEKLVKYESDTEMLAYLRLRTFILRHKNSSDNWRVADSVLSNYEAIVPAIDSNKLEKEIASLPAEQLLLNNGEFDVYYATADQAPLCLEEIGRLREITFRAVNEGTGKSIDVDRFDQYYIHLFLWNRDRKQIAGAYRLGKTDQIVSQYGISGLYTYSLFRYNEKLLDQLGPSLELGRSFIRREYQKSFSSLLLLWRGIGHFVVKYPMYKNLFGPVSISSDYDSASRQLIVSFLKANNFLPQLAKLIKPRKPLRNTRLEGVDQESITKVVKDINDISQFITEIEDSEMSVPILLKQYLKLGGKLLGFNVDPEFGNVLDGLILVDMTETSEKMRSRYLSEEGAVEFMEYHRNQKLRAVR